jgi:hypothetical protein
MARLAYSLRRARGHEPVDGVPDARAFAAIESDDARRWRPNRRCRAATSSHAARTALAGRRHLPPPDRVFRKNSIGAATASMA